MEWAAEPPRPEPRYALQLYYDRLLARLGPQGWWPARTRSEVILGAILTQNTAWQNARLALGLLREAGGLNLRRLERLSRTELENLVRPAGFYRQKARTIRNFLAWLRNRCQGSLASMFRRPPMELRRELLSVQGLGPETVDAILLYAGRSPFFVADAYTRRILERHGLLPANVEYEVAQRFLHANLPPDHQSFNEYHALLVEVGKRYCKRSAPRCEGCPLEDFLPIRKSTGTSMERRHDTRPGGAERLSKARPARHASADGGAI